MDKTHKIIVILLIVAIVISTLSIIISLTALNIDFSPTQNILPKTNTNSGDISFYIEDSENTSE